MDGNSEEAEEVRQTRRPPDQCFDCDSPPTLCFQVRSPRIIHTDPCRHEHNCPDVTELGRCENEQILSAFATHSRLD